MLFRKKDFLKIFSVIALMLFLSSCAAKNRNVSIDDGLAVATDEAVATESTREPVFIYGDPKLPKSLELKLSGEPLLFPSGYVRLVGVVSGWKPIACLEVGGRGLALGVGENVDGYTINCISEDRVVLIRKGGKS